MSYHLRVSVAPVDAADRATTYMGGTDSSIPVVAFTDSEHARGSVELALGNHPDPAAYLDDLARQCYQLAAQVRAAGIGGAA